MSAPRNISETEERLGMGPPPVWHIIALCLVGLAVLCSCPFVCGACAGLADRGYDVGAGR